MITASPSFPTSFFISNQQRLQALLPDDAVIVVAAHGLLQRNSDSSYPFRQDANFWYLSGIDEPDITLVVSRKECFLIVPPRDETRTVFDGAFDTAAMQTTSGAAAVYDQDKGWRRLGKLLKGQSAVYTPLAAPAFIERYGIFANPARSVLIERLQVAAPKAGPVDIREQLAGIRMIKQPGELVAIQAAIDTTLAGLRAVCQPDHMAKYAYEYEIEADLGAAYRRLGAQGHSFAPIVAAGARACQLHNVTNSGPLTDGQLVVIDTGAEVSWYAADITRTVAVGQPSARQREVHQAVFEVQADALQMMQAGMHMKAFEEQVEERMGQALKALGLIKRLERQAIRHYYPHATSHFMGLDVHDVGDYSAALPAGAVLTCEPGIYIPEEGIGVRIEDDVLLTEGGNQVLSATLAGELA